MALALAIYKTNHMIYGQKVVIDSEIPDGEIRLSRTTWSALSRSAMQFVLVEAEVPEKKE